ncbi:MAG: tRNA (guanosine(46)-N7)-methyltransferase TrmB [Bacteroidia bacterium]|nr:tRNA (guanosine(46)-N7)-methyltransferase TrmB [Bacteroidia bacterium]
MATFPNVFQPAGVETNSDIVFPLKGKWNKEYFRNSNPVILELGCGRGEYTFAMAQKLPQHNFIGMDIKGARIWKGAKKALEMKLSNVAFVRNRIDFIESYFGAGEISSIWLPFPDPFPRKENRRLVSGVFLNRYLKIASPGTTVHLKTDNRDLYLFAKEQVRLRKLTLLDACDDLYNSKEAQSIKEIELLTGIQTYYEKQFLAIGRKIHYLSFVL